MLQNDTPVSAWEHQAGLVQYSRPKTGSEWQRLRNARLKLDLYGAWEILTVAASGFAAAWLYVGNVLDAADTIGRYHWPIVTLPLLMGLIFSRSGLYDLDAITDFAGKLGSVAGAVTAAFVSVAILGSLLGETDNFSRVWFVSWFGISLTLLWLLRALAARTFSRMLVQGELCKRAAIFGAGPQFRDFLEKFDTENRHLEISAVFGGGDSVAAFEAERELRKLTMLARQQSIDLVIIALPNDHPELIARALTALCMLAVDIVVAPPAGFSHVPMLGVHRFGHHQFIEVQHAKVSGWSKLLKLLEDYAIASVALLGLSWLMLAIALAIKLESKGPVIYKQRRTGLNNKEFVVYKFRTMAAEADATGFIQAQPGDARVTKIGRLLRRTSLDELPQLFNVIKGQMSVVGPRPHPLELNEEYAPLLRLYNKRHSVKPGITGWAQINDHRGPTMDAEAMRKRLSCDLYYVDNWSIWLDLRIIAATPFMSMIHRNAV
ncbi:MAG: undecaprenyl-phosphate glucose phosphotransferase [Rhizobiaceae bacterium]